MRITTRVLSLTLLVGLAAMGSAATTTLSPTQDTRLLTFSPTGIFGADSIFSTYNAGATNDQRSLVQFDLSSIPAGDVITSATLNLWGDNSFGTGLSTTEIYRVTNPWVEMQATWLDRQTGVPWSTPGGDSVGTTGVANVNPYATWTGNQVTKWYTFNITSLVSEWHAGTHANYGLHMLGPDTNRLIYASKEHSQFRLRPYLTVTHQAFPEPATLLVSGLALLALRRRRRAA